MGGKKIRNKKRALVTGAGGFIGYHLVKFLQKKGYWVRGVDIKRPEFDRTTADEYKILDLRKERNCLKATKDIDEVYALAADMGGMGFISKYHYQIITNNILISTNTLRAACENKVKRYFFSSSACIYPVFKQKNHNVTALKESDAFPASPEDAYGWEKLATEIMCEYAALEHPIKVRVARFHNIYGPNGAWDGERAKAPASLCRKIAIAKKNGDKVIEVWGDGRQTRSFCYIDDCVEGVYKLMHSKYDKPLNIGRSELVSINNFVDLISEIAGVKLKKKHIKGPQGVRGRNSDNRLIKKVLGWEPKISLRDGMKKTYDWVEEQVNKSA